MLIQDIIGKVDGPKLPVTIVKHGRFKDVKLFKLLRQKFEHT